MASTVNRRTAEFGRYLTSLTHVSPERLTATSSSAPRGFLLAVSASRLDQTANRGQHHDGLAPSRRGGRVAPHAPETHACHRTGYSKRRARDPLSGIGLR